MLEGFLGFITGLHIFERFQVGETFFVISRPKKLWPKNWEYLHDKLRGKKLVLALSFIGLLTIFLLPLHRM